MGVVTEDLGHIHAGGVNILAVNDHLPADMGSIDQLQKAVDPFQQCGLSAP